MPKTAKRDWNAVTRRLKGEKLYTLEVACKMLPTERGKTGHAGASALWRWITRGKGGVFLDALKMGAGWVTSEEALLRFGAEVSSGIVPTQDDPSEADRQRRHKAAGEQMRAAGVRVRSPGNSR